MPGVRSRTCRLDSICPRTNDVKVDGALASASYSPAACFNCLRVRVQTRQQVADAEVSKDYEQETDDCEVGGGASLPAMRDARMQEGRVSEPGDERARLFRVPSPVASPTFIGPHSARDQEHRQPGEGHRPGLVHHAVELIRLGEHGAKAFSAKAEDDDE